MNTFRLGLLLGCSVLLNSVAMAQESLREAIDRDYDAQLGALFEHFHANPELPLREFETSARLASEIRKYGYDVTEGVGGTGIVAVLQNGAGPTVMLRADMDGLPVEEKTDLPYASKAVQEDIDGVVRPVMHACGHDVHITSLVGSAKLLAERRDDWSGTLVLIGQPAEERIIGARHMLEDGLYERFPKPDYALAFHVSAGQPSGTIEIRKGITYSSSDSVDIVVHGVGAHGASPHRGIDPVLIASQIVVTLQSVVSRNIAPLEPGVITVGSIHGGSKHNIIGERVHLQLTVRSDKVETRDILLDAIDRVAEGVARSLGVPDDRLPEVIRSEESTPPTFNDEALAGRLLGVFTDHFGEETMYSEPRESMGAEDFAFFVQPEHGVRGVYMSVGGTPSDEVDTAPSHHSPIFEIEPEPSIKAGTEAMVLAAMTLMPSNGD